MDTIQNKIVELNTAIVELRRQVKMHENKKRKVMEHFRNAKKKRDMLLSLFDDFTREYGLYEKWLAYRKTHSLLKSFRRLDRSKEY